MIAEIIQVEFFSLIALTITFLTVTFTVLALYIRSKSNIDAIHRYNFDKNTVELEYMRKNLENQLYKVSKKLEENEDRWKDINHLIITSQYKSENIKYDKNNIKYNSFLNSLGLNNSDFEIDERRVFALTPFNSEYLSDFDAIKDVCDSLKLVCVRGDEEYVPNDILIFILRQVVTSRLIVANITGRNPNVMYELGVAHALGKPTIIISKNFTDIPFDLKSKRIVIYESYNDLFEKLRNSITDLLVSGS